MGFFDIFKKKAEPAPEPVKAAAPAGPVIVAADAKGTIVPMDKIPDDVFAQGILGTCCGIDPSEGKVFAPVDGSVTQVPDTLHALGIQADNGTEILIHVGVDTVEMKGEGFKSTLKVGDHVSKGQLVLEMDLAKIAAAGHPAVVITVVTNSDDYASVELVAEGAVEPGADMLKATK